MATDPDVLARLANAIHEADDYAAAMVHVRVGDAKALRAEIVSLRARLTADTDAPADPATWNEGDWVKDYESIEQLQGRENDEWNGEGWRCVSDYFIPDATENEWVKLTPQNVGSVLFAAASPPPLTPPEGVDVEWSIQWLAGLHAPNHLGHLTGLSVDGARSIAMALAVAYSPEWVEELNRRAAENWWGDARGSVVPEPPAEPTRPAKCEKCDGTGQGELIRDEWLNTPRPHRKPCSNCSGTGVAPPAEPSGPTLPDPDTGEPFEVHPGDFDAPDEATT